VAPTATVKSVSGAVIVNGLAALVSPEATAKRQQFYSTLVGAVSESKLTAGGIRLADFEDGAKFGGLEIGLEVKVEGISKQIVKPINDIAGNGLAGDVFDNASKFGTVTSYYLRQSGGPRVDLTIAQLQSLLAAQQ